jgi:hypothetical protein
MNVDAGQVATALGPVGLLATGILAFVRGWVLPPETVAVSRDVYNAKVAECESWKKLAMDGLGSLTAAIEMAVKLEAAHKIGP